MISFSRSAKKNREVIWTVGTDVGQDMKETVTLCLLCSYRLIVLLYT